MNVEKKQLKSILNLSKSLLGINITGGPNPLIASRGKPSTEKKDTLAVDDWVRVRRGPMEGAEGKVTSMKPVSDLVTLVEIRQLNGNVIRLPRTYFEFTSFREQEVDRL